MNILFSTVSSEATTFPLIWPSAMGPKALGPSKIGFEDLLTIPTIEK